MSLTVLSVAYPFAPVGPDAVGGAEQILTHLDSALVAAGHKSLVLACEGSQTAGLLLPMPAARGALEKDTRSQVHHQLQLRLNEVLTEEKVDLVHMHGLDFHEYLPEAGVPVLVTLHLPPAWYPPEAFALSRPQTYLQCVSSSQRQACPSSPQLVEAVENGVAVDVLSANRHAKRNFTLALGRICPEKGFHLALEASARARTPMLLAGEVFRYQAHEQYFQNEILPRLDEQRRFIGPAGFGRKRRLLAAARCLLVPSLVAETSSLVAMEALACGTPVVAFPSGALAEIVEDGQTGYLVTDERAMAEAIREVDRLDPERCRRSARERFSCHRMVSGYLKLYAQLLTPGSCSARPLQAKIGSSAISRADPDSDRFAAFSRAMREVPTRIGNFEISLLERFSELEALRAQWDKLWLSDPSSTPFQSPAWLIPWWKHLAWGELWTLALFQKERLAGVLPAFREGSAGSRKLLLIGTGVSDYAGVTADPGFRQAIASAIYQWLGQCPGEWQCCDWQQLQPASPLLDVPSSLLCHRAVQEICPVVEFRAPGLSAVLPRRQLEKLRYYRRRAAALGRVDIDQASPETFHELFNGHLRLHQARWKACGSSGVLAHEPVQRFHREAAEEFLLLGLLRLYMLRINARPVASLYGFLHNQTFYYYLGGFDPEFASISPGTLLIGHAMEQAAAEGATRFDFLRGREPYKYFWGAKDSFTYRLELQSTGKGSEGDDGLIQSRPLQKLTKATKDEARG